jgi:G:T-mismatch repair DNA endonuclease (very short patch repair protein)
MKCPFCKKNLNKNDGHHIYKCKKNLNYDDIKIKITYIKYNYPYISDKNNLYNEYSINLRSFNDLRSEYGISYRNLDFLLKYYEIKKRNKKDSSKLISIEKYKKTCKLRYGVDNISKLKHIKDKKNIIEKVKKLKIVIEENKKIYDWIINESLFGNIYNVYYNKNENIIKNEYYKLIKKYNNHWKIINDDEKNIISKKTDSKLESEISGILDRLSISYIKNFSIGKNIYDIKISNTYLLIEINSDLWHANPKYYKNNDILNFPFKKEKVINIWNKDKYKKNIANDNGYNLIYIWEDDIKDLNYQDKMNFVVNKILDNMV